MLEKHIEKIKKIVDDIYFILVFMGFWALICYLPNEIANFSGIEFFRGNIALMLIIIVGFVLFRIYINALYETKKINEKYYEKNQNVK